MPPNASSPSRELDGPTLRPTRSEFAKSWRTAPLALAARRRKFSNARNVLADWLEDSETQRRLRSQRRDIVASLQHSCFVIPKSFVLRHSSFPSMTILGIGTDITECLR